MRRHGRIALAAVAWLVLTGARAEVEFTPEEVRRILAHGPWPPAFARDPSNRASGNAAAIDLGRRLFADAPLSANGYVACVSCHQTDRAWTDGVPRARGIGPLDRNAPSVANAWLNRWFGWAARPTAYGWRACGRCSIRTKSARRRNAWSSASS